MALPLASFGRVDGELTGGALQGERVQHTTTNVSGVREYQPGDTFNRIHWKTSARQRQLMVKEFELDPFADIWLVLDLDQSTMAGSGVESVEEYAVTICASLAKYFLDENRAVGFVLPGTAALAGPRHPATAEDLRSAGVRTSVDEAPRSQSCWWPSSGASVGRTPWSWSRPRARTAG